MAEFYINTETITRQSSRLTETGNSVRNVQTRVSNIASGLAGIGLGQVAPAIAALESRLARHVGKMNSLSSALGMSMLKYVTAESNIMGIPLFLNPDFRAVAGTVVGNTVSGLTGLDIPVWEGMFGGSYAYEEEIKHVILPFLTNTKYSWDDMYGSHELRYGVSPEVSADLIKFECHENEADRNWVDNYRREWKDGSKISQADTVSLFTVGASRSVSVLSDKGELNAAFGSLKGEYGLLNAEAGVSAHAGLFTADGKFAPGIGAEATASASLFKASGEARLGTDYYGAYLKGEVEVCSAEATASISAGLYDEHGKFDPSIGGKVEAEAVLAKATGSAGQRIMGTDVGLQGSIGVGVGAHAEIGFQDGKLSLGVGAYLGVGGSVSIELDFSDTYDTIVSGWNKVTNAASVAWDATTDFVSDAWDAATDFASDAWNATTDFVGDAWDAATDFASDAWDFITFWD